MITIRKVRSKDFEEVYKLYKEDEKENRILTGEFSPLTKVKTKKEFLEKIKKLYFLLAEEDKKVVGFFEGELLKHQKRGYISDIYIKKEYRKKGLATNMKELFVKELERKKFKEVGLHVHLRNSAIKLYKK